MHKITKGLKKKKKGKKSKHKDEELFKPEELEAYRREHQQAALPAPDVVNADPNAPAPSNDEWKKFNALTSGIDNFLKKTQDDLDRIKSTSFFQRVPTSSEVQREEAKAAEEFQQREEEEEAAKVKVPVVETGIVEVSESESDEEEEDDIFDTAYIDAIAAGDVKLAYIPESPTDQADGDDPFDTSIADRAILGPSSTRRGKKLVPLGSAVEVLTGRVQAPTCVPINRPSTRRAVLKEKNLLLTSFDEAVDSNSSNEPVVTYTPSLLDDDTALPLPDEPIDLSKTLHQIPTTSEVPEYQDNLSKVVLEDFDVIAKKESPIDDEFALLAAESITKTPAAVAILPSSANEVGAEENWQAFENEPHPAAEFNGVEEEFDPFDTTFAENTVPGKAELKIIENEILSTENDFDFDPRADDTFSEILRKRVSIQITDPSGHKAPERISEEDLNTLQLHHRDLLGGSITDLSSLGELPLQPKEKVDDNYIEYCDPFDTTIVDSSTAPGQTELKFLEKELLSDLLVTKEEVLSDDEFNPRAEEVVPQNRKSSIGRSVAFTLPIANSTDLFAELDDSKKGGKPLTPYYVRANSIPEEFLEEEENLEDVDPFDTSFVTKIGPGKAELKAIEKELFQPQPNLRNSISDPDFDPRDDKQTNVAKVVQTIKEINNPKLVNEPQPQVDLLTIGHEVETKILTPAGDARSNIDEISYVDPFDTSIASNILPGKAELKLLETELIHTQTTLKRVLTDPDFDPRDPPGFQKQEPKQVVQDFFEQTLEQVATKPLTPVNFTIDDEDDFDDIDPFDTSIANNIGPGQTELKLLESELI